MRTIRRLPLPGRTKTTAEVVSAAETALDQKRYRRAHRLLTRGARVEPTNLSIHFYLALANLHLRRFKDAERHARYVIRKDAKRGNAHLNLGVIKIHQGDATSALRNYRKEVRLHPGCYEAHFNLGLIHVERSEWRQVVCHLKKCWDHHHQGHNLEQYLAMAAQYTRDIELEVRVYTRALRANRRDVWALNNLAACRNREGKHRAALKLLREAIEIAPSDRMVKRNLKDTTEMVCSEGN